jgi:4-hydroxy-tetrahydrodipicolinate synthase
MVYGEKKYMLKVGFYTALGTPFDVDGHFIPSSFMRQVEDQVRFGASGLLVMGSMGLGVFIRNDEYVLVAQAAAIAAKSACPVFVGVSDVSIGRTRDRINALAGLPIDGIVATAPYYYSVTDQELVRYFTVIADNSPYPLYLYDLPAVAKNKITMQTMDGLKSHPNIFGIKTANLALSLELIKNSANGEINPKFKVLYSGLDTFDTAYSQGVVRNLDGMFACTGVLTKAMYEAFSKSDQSTGSTILKKIIGLRDVFAAETIFPSFTYAMNLLGYDGIFHPDYFQVSSENQKEKIRINMEKVRLLKQHILERE